MKIKISKNTIKTIRTLLFLLVLLLLVFQIKHLTATKGESAFRNFFHTLGVTE